MPPALVSWTQDCQNLNEMLSYCNKPWQADAVVALFGAFVLGGHIVQVTFPAIPPG